MTTTQIRRDRTTSAGSGLSAAAALDVSGRMLEGWASVVDEWYPVIDFDGDYDEVVRPNAFRAALRKRRPIVQWNHGSDVLGKLPIGKLLETKEDGKGLYFRAELFDVPALDLLVAGLRAGEINGASFRFRIASSGVKRYKDRTGREKKEILEVAEVYEMGPVTWPANPTTSVKLREGLRRNRTAAPARPTPAAPTSAAPAQMPFVPAGYMLVPTPAALRPQPAAPKPTRSTDLSARAKRHLMVWQHGVVTWAQLPSDIRAELREKRPGRVAMNRKLERDGLLVDLGRMAAGAPRRRQPRGARR